ncbi:6622_t:CDS:2, partial [Racocetra fulgida]
MARLNVKLLVLLLVILATVISAVEIDVVVGQGGTLTYTPSDITVKVGDTVIILPETGTVGASGTLNITQDLPSTFGIFCDVPGHCDGGLN